MTKHYHPLVPAAELHNGYRRALAVDGLSLLVLQHEDRVYIIENRCGHFGIPLEDGYIDGTNISCRGHGISFDLATGRIANRPWENCDPIRTFPVRCENGMIGVELETGSQSEHA